MRQDDMSKPPENLADCKIFGSLQLCNRYIVCRNCVLDGIVTLPTWNVFHGFPTSIATSEFNRELVEHVSTDELYDTRILTKEVLFISFRWVDSRFDREHTISCVHVRAIGNIVIEITDTEHCTRYSVYFLKAFYAEKYMHKL